MFENTDKKQLYWLMDQYLADKIDAWDFSNKYHSCYDVELDLDCLSRKEYQLFSDLSLMAGRFSPYKEDHIAQPGFFYTDEELRRRVSEIKILLKDNWPSFE
jgi:hypothetical protein